LWGRQDRLKNNGSKKDESGRAQRGGLPVLIVRSKKLQGEGRLREDFEGDKERHRAFPERSEIALP